MQITQVQIDSIKLNEHNPRYINDDAFIKLVQSVKQFPEMLKLRPIIVDKNNVILGGNMRYRACLEAGHKQVYVIKADTLTDEQTREFLIKDNIAAGSWDYNVLANEWDVELLEEWGLELPVNFDDYINTEEQEALTDEDAIPDLPGEPITKLGDVWLLGKHRVLCGDSTSIDAVENLMDGNKADMVFTDPPYNVSFNGRSGKHEIIKNDNLSEENFIKFIDEIISIIKILNPLHYYIWCNWQFYGILQNKLDYKACIVWAKNVFGLGIGYRHQHEFCLFNGKIDETIKNESDLWHISRDTNYQHPTQKPVELANRAIIPHQKAINIVALFGGSGSTLIACEKTNRKCYMMELDTKYCDVIVKRWQEYTGKTAVLESTKQSFNELQNGKN